MRDKTVKKSFVNDSEAEWICDHKTIFDDRTEGSDFRDQQLAALEPPTPLKKQDVQESRLPDSDSSTKIEDKIPDDPDPYEDVQFIENQRDRSASTTAVWGSPLEPPIENSSLGRGLFELAVISRRNSVFHMDDDMSNFREGSIKNSCSDISTMRHRAENDDLRQTKSLDDEAQTPNATWSTEALMRRIESLNAELGRLKTQMGTDSQVAQLTEGTKASRWRTIYRIGKASYLAPPSWMYEEQGTMALKGESPLLDLSRYLNRHTEIAFVAFKDYRADARPPEDTNAGNHDTLPSPEPFKEAVQLTSLDMIQAMRKLVKHIPGFDKSFSRFDLSEEIAGPYLFWYHSRNLVDDAFDHLISAEKSLIRLFQDWIEASHGNEWTFVDSQFSAGLVSPLSMKYLIRPGDVLIKREGRLFTSFIAREWLKYGKPKEKTAERLEGRAMPPPDTSRIEEKTNGTARTDLQEGRPLSFYWKVDSWSWSFNGEFRKAKNILLVELTAQTYYSTVRIDSLPMFPLRFGEQELEVQLSKRGIKFWECRERKLVSLLGKHDDHMSAEGDRYMVDVATYFQYRQSKEKLRFSGDYESGRMRAAKRDFGDILLDTDTEAFESETESEVLLSSDVRPEAPGLLVFPPKIVAYDLRRKLWVDLEVDRIQEVSWNKKTFDNLAIDKATKDLLKAVVMYQIKSSENTDIIADKGNGLIILLHGGPGTGKTFTAEGMAEYAQKPLYRVTCGDIGTNPEQVETYLDSVLHLGTIWDCVLLLDEADVFLEERGQDLARNALVSVFLRVLEYYQGILVLTSNRVGVFDEAFKSRIQLTLHYDRLDRAQRSKIWRNFIERLKTLGRHKVDFDDLRDHENDLVEQDMNGRQIRNVITTARQWAQYQNEKLCYQHLQHVISICRKFDTYIQSIKLGMTEEELARDGGLR